MINECIRLLLLLLFYFACKDYERVVKQVAYIS